MSGAPLSGERGRFSSERKTATVIRLLRGGDLELVSRELGVTAAPLSGWRDDFLAGGQAALKSRPTTGTTRSPDRRTMSVICGTRSGEVMLRTCRHGDHFTGSARERAAAAQPVAAAEMNWSLR